MHPITQPTKLVMPVGWSTVVFAILLLFTGFASADVAVSLDGYFYDSGNSVWKYTYGIDNSSGTENIYSFWLDPIDRASIIGSPSFWDPASQSDAVGGYVSWGAQSGHYLGAGTLTGFQVESPYAPGDGYVSWSLYGDSSGNWSGSISGPVAPEPSSLALVMMAGGAGLLAVRRKGGRRSKS